ncbi:MAG: autoinducer binding domain-containing protein [Alphaproteobacteria bacterium]
MDKISVNQIPNYQTETKMLSLIGNMGYLVAYNYRTTGPEYLDCTYPQEWQDKYAAEFLVAQDPTVTYSMAKPGNYRWSEVKIPDIFGLLKKARKFDLNYGATLSRKEGVRGRSFLAVARNDREITDDEMTILSDRLDFYRENFANSNTLTKNELTTLKMLSDDYSIEDIEKALSVSRSTANSWVKSLKRKLGCKKITTAIAIASKRNWL